MNTSTERYLSLKVLSTSSTGQVHSLSMIAGQDPVWPGAGPLVAGPPGKPGSLQLAEHQRGPEWSDSLHARLQPHPRPPVPCLPASRARCEGNAAPTPWPIGHSRQCATWPKNISQALPIGAVVLPRHGGFHLSDPGHHQKKDEVGEDTGSPHPWVPPPPPLAAWNHGPL